MILASDFRLVLVHFDAGADFALRTDAHNGRRNSVSDGTLARMRWYLEWSAECSRTVHLLVPSDLTSPDYEFFSSITKGKVIRYHDEGDVVVPQPRKRGFTLIINGNQFPMVNWGRALASAQRQNADVVVFGPSGPHTSTDCPESVLIDADGQVIRFKRHYVDSPGFADRWSGDAAFLVVKSEHAQAVAAHVVVRGWGLDSIGALVRRFGVRWLTDSSVLSDDRLTFNELGMPSRDRMTSWRVPVESAASKHENGAIHIKNSHRQTQVYPAMSIRNIVVDDFKQRSSDGSVFLENPTGEYTLSTDDLPEIKDSRSYLIAKRAFDVAVSVAGLIVISPLLLIVSILVKLTSQGPVFYAHTRQGLGGREFPCLKFRSMRTDADAIQALLRAQNEVDGPQFKMARDPRVTRLGYWLRKTNIDELPQLYNVLVGHMSLVGPRPSPDQENQYCPAWRRARLSSRPGITGLWQVLRNREDGVSDFQEWIYYDVEYAQHRSFWLDLQILFYTPIAIFAPSRVAPFAARLERADICAHSEKMVYKPA